MRNPHVVWTSARICTSGKHGIDSSNFRIECCLNFSNGLDMWPWETLLKSYKYRGENVLREEQDRAHFINEEMQPHGGGVGGNR